MGFFNFIETFFFISLAITFILIMMLVYHFKDRVSILENKCDTMYNIIDDMAKEVNQLHAVCSKPKPPIVQDAPFHMHVPQFFPQPNFFTNKIIVSDNEDSEYSSDEESDDERESENSDDGIVITESENMNHEVLAEIDDSLNVPITEVAYVPEDSSPIEELVEEDVQVLSQEEDAPVLSQEEDGNDSIGQDVDTNVYKKMEVSALRSLVLSKGLATDVKKLKKTELIDLLILQS